MGCEIEKMYLDLNKLLEDICKFLSSDKLERLSPKDQRLAESLINRSKVQLQEIAKIQPSLQCNEDYVIMNNQVPSAEEEEECGIYSSVDDLSKQPDRAMIIEHDFPYENLPAKDADYSVKSGWLSMRRKFLLGFEKMKRVYVTIHKDWLLIYLTEKDTKPLCTFNMKYFEAKESDGGKSNFELISTKHNDNKVYYFIALTHKDMLQWTVQANKCHDKAVLKNKNIDTPNSNYEKEYSNTPENINNSVNDDDDSDGIYEELTIVKKPPNLVETEKSEDTCRTDLANSISRPRLPLRPGSKKIKGPVKIPPPMVKSKSVSTNNSSDSLVSYHEICTELPNHKSNSNSTKSLDDSFSDNSVDSTYEMFATVKQNMTALNKPVKNFNKSFNNKKNTPPPAVPNRKKN